jgi:hypothetical protein
MTGASSHIQMIRAALDPAQETERFNAAHNFLRSRVIATRDTPIGRDFLFPADAAGTGAALKDLAEIEHDHGGDLHFNYTEVGGYFLLRVAGASSQRADIEGYFD